MDKDNKLGTIQIDFTYHYPIKVQIHINRA